MIFFHISHTDLDGYGCQLIAKKIFPDGFYFNANYGIEVKTTIDVVLQKVTSYKNDDIFILISDLNLTLDESKALNRNINNLIKNGYNIKLQLLDHHATGKPSSLKYDWYFLDTTRSATKIVFDYFSENYLEFLPLCDTKFKTLIEAIDDVDIWCENDPYFEFGKVLLRLISHANEINATMFPKENRAYRLALLKKATQYIEEDKGHILLDDQIHFIKKEYLNLTSYADTIDNLTAKYLVYLLEHKKENLTIYYKQYKGLLTFSLSNISIPANTFLKAHSDYDFFINIGRRGTVGLRANGNIDVSLLASKLANGGGHPNASGASFKNWKEKVRYDDVKQFLEEKLKDIS